MSELRDFVDDIAMQVMQVAENNQSCDRPRVTAINININVQTGAAQIRLKSEQVLSLNSLQWERKQFWVGESQVGRV